MPKYIVNRNTGWGGHSFGEEFESDATECVAAEDQGFLIATTITPAVVYAKESKTTTLSEVGDPPEE